MRLRGRQLWLRRAVAVAAATVAALALAEVALRLSRAEIYPVPLYPGDVAAERDRTFDAVLGWRLPPGESIHETTADYDVVYRANAQGFRSHYDFAAPSTAKRIAFLGDSFTFGSGVREDETFAALVERELDGSAVERELDGSAGERELDGSVVERELDESAGERELDESATERRSAAAEPGAVQALNYGIGGFGIDQMFLTLDHVVLPLGADLVVLSFIRQDLDRSLSSYRQGHIWLEKPAFHLANGALVRTTPANRPGPLASWVAQDLRLWRLGRKAVDALADRWPIGARWQLNRALFARIRDACIAARVPLLVVHLPVNPRARAPLYAEELAGLGIDDLDLAALLPAAADDLYFPHDHHFTPAGHRFAGQAIARRIAARGWIRAPAPERRNGRGATAGSAHSPPTLERREQRDRAQQ